MTFPFDGLSTQQANAAQTGSNAFDVFQINEQWTGTFYENGWVSPLKELDPDFSWDPGLIEYDGVGRWDAAARVTSPEGEVFSLPFNGNILLYIYRTDVYEEMGFDIPTTWEEVLSQGAAAADAGAIDHGFVGRGKGPTFDYSAILYSEGGSLFVDEANGDWTPALDTPEAIRALTTFRDLLDLGPDAPQTIAQAEATSLMQSGTVMASALVAAVASPLEDESASLIAGDVGYGVLPGGATVSGTWTMGVPAGLPEDRAQAAYEFMTWLTSKETMEAWSEIGGVPTRNDMDSDRPEIKAMVDSEAIIHGGLRYTFTPAYFAVSNPILEDMVAGVLTPEEASAALQEAVTSVVKEAGFLE